jgi:hypothetical protein
LVCRMYHGLNLANLGLSWRSFPRCQDAGFEPVPVRLTVLRIVPNDRIHQPLYRNFGASLAKFPGASESSSSLDPQPDSGHSCGGAHLKMNPANRRC